MKLLIVDLYHPNKTSYHSPYNIAAFMLGRRLSNYLMFAVGNDGSTYQINVTTADCVALQKQVLAQLQELRTKQ